MRKGKSFLLFLTLTLIFIIIYSTLSSFWKNDTNEILDTSSCEQDFPNFFLEKLSAYRQCLLQNVKTAENLFVSLNSAVKECMEMNLWRSFQTYSLNNYDEVKMAILPTPIDKSQPCIEVTLGVGRNILAEKKLRRLMPHCQFHGADPILSSGMIFKTIGRYYQIGVGAETGIMQASVLESGDYKSKDIKTVNFLDFLNQYVKSNKVDYLWMDNEGPEYEIFSKYLINNVNVTICQIDVEMHSPLKNYGMSDKEFDKLLLAILSRSPYLPIWSDRGDAGHIQTLYINVVDPYCLKKYFLYKFCAHS